MTIVFDIRDVSGRTIYLTEERWRHILKHPEMTDKLELMMQTLVRPLKITSMSADSFVRFYYAFLKENRKYLFISVKYLNGKGFVITSFYTDKIL